MRFSDDAVDAAAEAVHNHQERRRAFPVIWRNANAQQVGNAKALAKVALAAAVKQHLAEEVS